jgi:hypothetical protein
VCIVFDRLVDVWLSCNRDSRDHSHPSTTLYIVIRVPVTRPVTLRPYLPDPAGNPGPTLVGSQVGSVRNFDPETLNRVGSRPRRVPLTRCISMSKAKYAIDRRFCISAALQVQQRAFFITERGYYGMGLKKVQPGVRFRL